MPGESATNIQSHFILAQWYFDTYRKKDISSVIGHMGAQLKHKANVSQYSGLVIGNKDWVELVGNLKPYNTWVYT